MPGKLKDDLIVINLLSLLLLLSILFLPESLLRIIPGIPFSLFLPGYSLVAALYPRKSSISGTERIIWSIGLSITIVPLTGLFLNLIPPGINLMPAVISITSFIFIMSVVAWYRRRKLMEYERFSLSFSLNTSLMWRDKSVLDRVLFYGLVLAVLCALGVTGYKIANPVPEEKVTEFYILNVDGNAFGYPDKLKIGEEGKVIVGITNSEHKDMTYRMEMNVNGVLYETVGGITLRHGETKRMEITFNFSQAGDGQKVGFVLYGSDETGPLVNSLYIRVDIIE